MPHVFPRRVLHELCNSVEILRCAMHDDFLDISICKLIVKKVQNVRLDPRCPVPTSKLIAG